MPAIVTDKLRILNAKNFVDSVDDTSNSYYVFVGLSNPDVSGFGRSTSWESNTPNPTDNIDYLNHNKSTILFGKKITSSNIKRVVRKINWQSGRQYEMYRPDYSVINPSPTTGSMRLYSADYYVINSEFKVYICIDNGSSGIKTTGNASQVEPTFTDLEPSKLSDGYTWKYLFTVSPSDIVKFDSTEYITLPNDWETTSSADISAVRENGDSSRNENQIKKVYIENRGSGYVIPDGTTANLVGDGSGGRVSLNVDNSGRITDVTVIAGGKNYTFALVDLGTTSTTVPSVFAQLIPIIPPSKGHGFDVYQELGADKILIYARFDDSTKDFPVDSKFAQIGILKNPTIFDNTGITTQTYIQNEFSGVYALKLNSVSGTVNIGDRIEQSVTGGTAYGYVVSYDSETKILKYSQDRSLYYNGGSGTNHTDFIGITSFFNSSTGTKFVFDSSNTVRKSLGGFSASVDSSFSGITTTISNKIINLGMEFTSGLSNPEINNTSGEIIYIDNRPLVTRDLRQKEDIKIILEF
tara:strand:- start:7567 stop:9138 length:1572 start_codon:yes stop_codon:yes gene_type:complete